MQISNKFSIIRQLPWFVSEYIKDQMLFYHVLYQYKKTCKILTRKINKYFAEYISYLYKVIFCSLVIYYSDTQQRKFHKKALILLHYLV